MEEEPLLRVENLKKYFNVKNDKHKKAVLKAVDGISMDIGAGETVGLVGESGCGKSTFGRAVLQLHSITSGKVYFRGKDITGWSDKDLRPIRKDMQIIFQDPFASLNPRKTIFETVMAPLDAFDIGTKEERQKKVREMLEFVGLPEYQFHKMPHEMSGGQRQRAVIARAMITDPAFIVCDEPVSALDVSVRAQVLNLMKDAQKATGVAYLFISHDMSVIRYLCDKVAVMYLGRLVEYGTKEEIFGNPLHPYTKALLSAIPVPDVGAAKPERIRLVGDVPSPLYPPSGCRLHNRCPYATEECSEEGVAQMVRINDNHMTACPFTDDFENRLIDINRPA
ncbi:MAG: ABC transporter ATP-binding protein [Lachnospiraceae bacterium]